MDSTGYPASDEPIRARVECYSPRWQILMSDNATREVCFRTCMAVNAYSNKLCVLLEPPLFLSVPVSTVDYDNLF